MERLIELRKETELGILRAPITQAVMADQLEADLYQKYLLNVWHYALHSSKVIGLAGSRAVNSHPELADYLFHHAQEEMGHDEWVMEDLIHLGWTRERVASTRPTPHCAAMIGYEYYLAGVANPIALFGWLYILEAMGDDLGREVGRRIASHPALANSVKFVVGHGEADEAHSADLSNMIARHVQGPDMEDVIHVAEVITELYIAMFHEIGA